VIFSIPIWGEWKCIYGGELLPIYCNSFLDFESTSLAQCLLYKGHKVIVVTHDYSVSPSLVPIPSPENVNPSSAPATFEKHDQNSTKLPTSSSEVPDAVSHSGIQAVSSAEDNSANEVLIPNESIRIH
jgi:hypothetical protein